MGTEGVILLDTHALLWLAQGEARLGVEARLRIEAEAVTRSVLVSAISFWEIAMLHKKQRIMLDQPTQDWTKAALAGPGIRLAPFEPAIAVAVGEMRAGIHGDPADRILIATARHHGAPLLTADEKILAYAAAGHVQAIDARG